MNYSDAVIKGAQALDVLVGKVSWLTEGWRDKIDPEILDMSSMSKCVLGQLHPKNDYDEAVYDIRRVEDDFDTYPFGVGTSEWIAYLSENNKFSIGSKWVSKHNSTYTMTIQGFVNIEGRGGQYVYLTSDGGVIVRGADLIQGQWRPVEKMPKFELGQQVLFQDFPSSHHEFYYIDSRDVNGHDTLRLGNGVFIMERLTDLVATYGTPRIGSGNLSYHLGVLRAAMNSN